MSERKEIIQINGITILVVCVIVANIVMVSFITRWAMGQRLTQEKRQVNEFTKYLLALRSEKIAVVDLEGARNWESTLYNKHRIVTDTSSVE